MVLWNRVLKSRGESSDMTNEEIAAERADGEVVVTISRCGWKDMLRNSAWLSELLDIVETRPSAAHAWLQARGVELVDSFPPWRPSERVA